MLLSAYCTCVCVSNHLVSALLFMIHVYLLNRQYLGLIKSLQMTRGYFLVVATVDWCAVDTAVQRHVRNTARREGIIQYMYIHVLYYNILYM